MIEGKPVGVEELTLQAVLLATAVGRVANQWVSNRGEVGADLVRATGLQAGLEVGLGGQELEHFEVCAGLPRGSTGDRHAVALARGAANRGIDRARSRSEVTLGQGKVDPLDLAALDLCLQSAVGGIVASDDQKTAGVLVEAVDDPRPLSFLPPPSMSPSSLTRVAPVCEGAGWTTRPAGLSTTAKSSST